MNARETLIAYLRVKLEECDWHGVADAACDLRVLEAREQANAHNEPASALDPYLANLKENLQMGLDNPNTKYTVTTSLAKAPSEPANEPTRNTEGEIIGANQDADIAQKIFAPAIAAIQKKIANDILPEPTAPPLSAKAIIAEEKRMEQIATPGEYRLKRSWLGKIGSRLNECRRAKLDHEIARYRGAIAGGQAVHPDVALDVAAAERYLEALK